MLTEPDAGGWPAASASWLKSWTRCRRVRAGLTSATPFSSNRHRPVRSRADMLAWATAEATSTSRARAFLPGGPRRTELDVSTNRVQRSGTSLSYSLVIRRSPRGRHLPGDGLGRVAGQVVAQVEQLAAGAGPPQAIDAGRRQQVVAL